LVRDENKAISNETLWDLVYSLPSNSNRNKSQSYAKDDFGTVSKVRITKICEDKFGAFFNVHYWLMQFFSVYLGLLANLKRLLISGENMI
jgi:hypothetical protein